MNDLEPSTRREEQVTEEEPNGVKSTPPPAGIGVYERPERSMSPVVIGLVIFFVLLIAAAVILFVL